MFAIREQWSRMQDLTILVEEMTSLFRTRFRGRSISCLQGGGGHPPTRYF